MSTGVGAAQNCLFLPVFSEKRESGRLFSVERTAVGFSDRYRSGFPVGAPQFSAPPTPRRPGPRSRARKSGGHGVAAWPLARWPRPRVRRVRQRGGDTEREKDGTAFSKPR
jgi:hypothetical protein